ncbi:NAD(P)H-dependent flavin oxidoreductase [Leucobacter sp. USHLN153]|uniref:NAD(P)H-dependent flavin oxidoreductase n=1 Tax=Leucobacter sp. USHLN153 TaxID=3081268 RepID=UPI0030171DCB
MGAERVTEWARDLGLRVPVVCAPMGGAAGGELATAVSRAGGLGMIGMGSAASVPALERELAALGEDIGGVDGHPFGIGLVAWGIERDRVLFERALAAGPALVSVSFGDWVGAERAPEWIAAVHDVGAVAVTQAATAEEAERAAEAGVDVIVARGREGGGHGDHQEPRDELLQAVLAVVDVPVLAAGGIVTATDLERVLDAGAAGAWVGTAFAACAEALTPPAAREVMFASDAGDTLVTRVFDVALELPWPSRFPERLIRTPFIDRWHGRANELARDAAARAEFRAAVEAGDYTVVPVDAGEGVGRIERLRTAAEVIEALTAPTPSAS